MSEPGVRLLAAAKKCWDIAIGASKWNGFCSNPTI
jgi:hypothetical protein